MEKIQELLELKESLIKERELMYKKIKQNYYQLQDVKKQMEVSYDNLNRPQRPT